jgi:ABC-type amino acid transport substrate-binding protein
VCEIVATVSTSGKDQWIKHQNQEDINMKKAIYFVIALALVGTFVFIQTSKERMDSASDQPIRVGMSGSYKPYTYLDESGELTGFDVAVWREIGKRIDREITFVTSDFSGLFGMLEAGQIDTIANQITITSEREETYLFTEPYVFYGAQLMVHEDETEISSLEDLKGKSVGVSLGSNYEEMVRSYSDEIEVITYDSGSGSYQDLAVGRIDAVLNDRLALMTTVEESGLPVKLAGEPVEELFNAFPWLPLDHNRETVLRVNDAIRAMYADGTMQEISLTFFPVDITER